MKACVKCGEVKALQEFGVRLESKDGRMGRCKACVNARRSITYTAEQRAAHRAKWKQGRDPSWFERNAQYKRSVRAKQGAVPKCRWVGKLAADAAEMDAQYNEVRKHIKACRREAANPRPKVDHKAKAREWFRRKMRDPSYVISVRMRVAIRKALQGNKAGRRWETILGYTLADLVAHFERMMPAGYSMADFFNGRLHIDHITPKSLFDCTDEAQLRACWCLSNLRPLPAKENLAKRDKILVLL